MMKVCYVTAQKLYDEGKLPAYFFVDDAAAVAMYTFDFGPKEYDHNPYRIINRELNGRTANGLIRIRDALYLLMKALRKLPIVKGKTLYRGVKCRVDTQDQYREGSVITWAAFTSTSPDIKATKYFLTKDEKITDCTLFIIENGWGYDIQPYSLFPDEEEILLEPERRLKVVSIVDSEDILIINLEMVDAPLMLPSVYGHGYKVRPK